MSVDVINPNQPERDRILIIGSGIAGVATALAIARQGIAVRVLERAPVIAEVGAGLQLGPNAGRILDKLDVRKHMTHRAVLPNRAVMVNINTAEEITSVDFGPDFRERFGAPYSVMHRGDLLTALMKSCAETGLVTIEPGKELVDVSQDADTVTAVCADGTTYRADALIAADGIRSTVRKFILDNEPPQASRYVIYRGSAPRTTAVENAVKLYAGEEFHLMQYPIRGGELVNRVASFKSTVADPGSEGWGSVEELQDRFSGACQEVRDAVAQLDTSMRWVQFDRDPQSGWAQGRIVLTGDAAHPMHQYLAQGACQAMEDAVMLADLIVEHGDDLPAAWQTFEARRFPRTSTAQRASRFWGELSHAGGSGAAARDYLLRQLAATDYRFIDWLYSPDEGHALPQVPPHHEIYAALDSERALA